MSSDVRQLIRATRPPRPSRLERGRRGRTTTSAPSGISYGPGTKLTTHRKPGSGERQHPVRASSSQVRVPSPNAGFRRRSASAARYRFSMLAGLASCAATVRSAQCAGCGSQGGCSTDPNPNGGSVPDHGIGTRQPSRPRTVWPDRFQVGSCNTRAGPRPPPDPARHLDRRTHRPAEPTRAVPPLGPASDRGRHRCRPAAPCRSPRTTPRRFRPG